MKTLLAGFALLAALGCGVGNEGVGDGNQVTQPVVTASPTMLPCLPGSRDMAPGPLAGGSQFTLGIPVPGASVGDPCALGTPAYGVGGNITGTCNVAYQDEVVVKLLNGGTSTQTGISGVYRVCVIHF